MNDPQSSTSIQPAPVPSFPTLPDPHALWSQPQSIKYLLQEARANIASLDGLKTHIQSGRINYGLEPPTTTSLVELPPIPVPNQYTPTTSGRIRPIEIPDLPISWKDKGKGREGLNVFKGEWGTEKEGGGWLAQETYAGKAIRVSSPTLPGPFAEQKGGVKIKEGIVIWATISGEDGVDSVKVFVGKSSSTSDLMSPGWHIGLSNHLTSLNLTLAELLYRIPHLPQLLHSTCFFCGKYLKVPDGLPVQHTGYLPDKGQGKGTGGDGGEGVENGKNVEEEKEGDGGRWVCWHDSCGEQ